MANVMRKRWDFKANPAWILEFRVLDATAVEIGDLMWMDAGSVKASPSNDVKPASSTALWTGSLAGTQGKLAKHFVGVAMESKTASDGKLTIRVACRGVFGLPGVVKRPPARHHHPTLRERRLQTREPSQGRQEALL